MNTAIKRPAMSALQTKNLDEANSRSNNHQEAKFKEDA
jgi:hypothetical protein